MNHHSCIRLAVLIDYAFSTFQESPRLGINRYLRESGIEAVYFGIGGINTDNIDDRVKLAFLDFITPTEFDGIIIVSATLMNQGGQSILEEKLTPFHNLPIISIGPSLFGEDSLLYDNETGMRSVMDHLINVHNYRSFAYVSGPESSTEAQIRRSAFRASLDAAGIKHNYAHEYNGDFLPPSGKSAVSVFLDQMQLSPDVIVCANDFMAFGVWSALKDRGLSVPYDIALTGFDDSQMSHALSHQITTVRQPYEDLGYLAARRIHRRIAGDTLTPCTPLSTDLRIRSSCGCVTFESRGGTAVIKQQETSLSAIKQKIIRCLSGDTAPAEVYDLYKSWSQLIYKTLNRNQPTYRLEETLREAKQSVSAGNQHDSLLMTLYSLLLEECAQTVFVDYWHENIFSMNLHIIVDHLQTLLASDLSIQQHPDILRDIAHLCNAESFHIIEFQDLEEINGGADIIFSEGDPYTKSHPSPGNWFPPRGSGSFVANMIASNGERYGYMLLDAHIPVVSVYEYLRLRFSTISKDLRAITSIRKLNDDLIFQIAEKERAEEKLREALSLVQQLAIEDELTGLHNRRGFFSLAQQQIKYLRRQNKTFFLLYADLDGLKEINDRWGHQEGDIAIQSAAEVFRDALRESDILARLGGDEFTALINKANPPEYEMIRDRIMSGCTQKNEQLQRPWKLSISIGHYCSTPDCTLELHEMLALADDNLYREKQQKK